MELILKTNLEAEVPAVIDWNHEQLKTELSERLSHYNALVVTEDAIKEAKDDRAKLNKLRTALDDKRKEVKKQCLRPYEDFEVKVKELIALVDQPIAAIDGQVKAFEELELESKLATIATFYRANIGALEALLPMERILPDKWRNKGYRVIDITQDMMDIITKTAADMKILKAMKLPFEETVLDVYIRTLDMSAALAEKTRMEEQAERINAAVPAPEAAPLPDNAPAPTPPQMPLNEDVAVDGLKDIDVRFYATTAAFRADMKALTDRHGIKYGRVK